MPAEAPHASDPLDCAERAYADALGAGFTSRVAMARALEAVAFADLPAIVSGPKSHRVNRKTVRKAQRVLLAIADKEAGPIF